MVARMRREQKAISKDDRFGAHFHSDVHLLRIGLGAQLSNTPYATTCLTPA